MDEIPAFPNVDNVIIFTDSVMMYIYNLLFILCCLI